MFDPVIEPAERYTASPDVGKSDRICIGRNRELDWTWIGFGLGGMSEHVRKNWNGSGLDLDGNLTAGSR